MQQILETNPLSTYDFNGATDFVSIREQKEILGVDDDTFIYFGYGVVDSIPTPTPPEPQFYTVTVSANPKEGGSVTGGGTYEKGTPCQVSAEKKKNYAFVNWTESDKEVSNEDVYKFELNNNRNLVANFISTQDNILKFTAINDSRIGLCYMNEYSLPNIEYSSDDGKTWKSYTILPKGSSPDISLSKGKTIKFRGENNYFSKKNSFCKFVMVGSFSASGDVTSLLNGVGGDAELTEFCFGNMFADCKSLTTAPALPATTLAEGCYSDMFSGCTKLTTAPELPATTLAQSCYSNMFKGCTSLTKAPKLPATTLVGSCYQNMFDGCTLLTTAPELPTTTLADYCYQNMFYGCENLNSIICLATDISASSCTNRWVEGVANNGTFIKNRSMGSWTSGKDGIPEGWTVKNQSD